MEKTREYHLRAFGVQPDFEDFILNNSAKAVVDDGLAMLAKRGVISKWRKDSHGYPLVKNEAALAYYATHADRRLYSPTADQNIVVMGAGNWGFALASLIGNRILDDRKYSNASITIFDPREDRAEQMNRDRIGSGRFAEQLLPKNVFVTSDFSSAFRKASEVMIALKPQDFEDNFSQMLAVSQQPFKAVIATRGFVPGKNTIPYLAAIDMLKFVAVFNRSQCKSCSHYSNCPSKLGVKSAYVRYNPKQQRLACRRAHEQTDDFIETYRWRAGVEATMSEFDKLTGVKKLRVRGRKAVRYFAIMKAAGLNLLRAARVMRAREKASGTNGPGIGLVLFIFKAVKERGTGFLGNSAGICRYPAVEASPGPGSLELAA